MRTETKTNLDDKTITKLQKLTRANLDSVKGFKECSEEIENVAISELFCELAAQRSDLATELQQHVTLSGEQAEDDGSVAAAVHRTWIDVRSKISGGDAYAILAEAERGEDHIKAAYEDVLKATAGSAVNDVLQRQYAKVKAGHDRVRELRDHLKNSK